MRGNSYGDGANRVFDRITWSNTDSIILTVATGGKGDFSSRVWNLRTKPFRFFRNTNDTSKVRYSYAVAFNPDDNTIAIETWGPNRRQHGIDIF